MKRILCMLLAVCMVLSFMPRTAAAQETRQTPENTIPDPIHLSFDPEKEEEPTLPSGNARLSALTLPKSDTADFQVSREHTTNDVSLVIRTWISESDFGDATSGSLYTGVRYYYNYAIFDETTGTYLDDLVDADYSVLLAIYDPDGSVVHSYSFDFDSGWISTVFFEPGQYRFQWSVSGDINGSDYVYKTVLDNPNGIEPKQIHCDPESMTLAPGGSDEIGRAHV